MIDGFVGYFTNIDVIIMMVVEEISQVPKG